MKKPLSKDGKHITLPVEDVQMMIRGLHGAKFLVSSYVTPQLKERIPSIVHCDVEIIDNAVEIAGKISGIIKEGK